MEYTDKLALEMVVLAIWLSLRVYTCKLRKGRIQTYYICVLSAYIGKVVSYSNDKDTNCHNILNTSGSLKWLEPLYRCLSRMR